MAAVLIDQDRTIARAVIGATEDKLIVIEEGFKPGPDFDNARAVATVEAVLPDLEPYKRRLHAAALRRAVIEAVG